MTTKSKPRKTGKEASRSNNPRIDASDLPIIPHIAIDTKKPAFRHLDSSLWRRNDRTLAKVVSDTTRPDNLETRYLRKLKIIDQ